MSAVVLDHTWRPRVTYKAHLVGTREVRDPIECGYVTNQNHNSTVFGPDHCNRPPEEHEWARGWVPGSIEPFPF